METVGPMGTPGYMAPEQEAAQETGVGRTCGDSVSRCTS